MNDLKIITFVYLLLSIPFLTYSQVESNEENINHEELSAILKILDTQISPGMFKELSEGNSLSQDKSMLSSTEKGIRKALKLIPSSELRRGLKEYLEIIGIKSYQSDYSVGTSNDGLTSHFNDTLINNPCFGKIAKGFYEEISEIDQSIWDKNREEIDKKKLRRRPSLNDISGEGVYKNLEPGWLLKKAMKHTNQNPLLALTLIGMCGHDDQSMTTYHYFSNGEAYSKHKYVHALNQILSGVDRAISASEDEASKSFFNKQKVKFNNLISKIEKDQVKIPAIRSKQFSCPGLSSALYLPQSFGNRVDIPKELKETISKIQAPNMGGGALPAKNYHVLASAFLGCKLAQNGVKPKQAAAIQSIASWGYRTVRMDEYISEKLKKREAFKAAYKKEREKFREKNKTMVKTRRGRKWKYPLFIKFEDWFLSQEEVELEVDGHKYTEYISGQQKKKLVEMDAAYLLDKKTLGGKSILGIDIPHTNLILDFGFPKTKPVILSDDKNKKNSFREGKGLSQSRYDKAFAKMNTLLVDWKWTVYQHGLGAIFGASFCSELPKDFNLDKVACGLLGTPSQENCAVEYSDNISKINSVIKDKLNSDIIFENEKPGTTVIKNLY